MNVTMQTNYINIQYVSKLQYGMDRLIRTPKILIPIPFSCSSRFHVVLVEVRESVWVRKILLVRRPFSPPAFVFPNDYQGDNGEEDQYSQNVDNHPFQGGKPRLICVGGKHIICCNGTRLSRVLLIGIATGLVIGYKQRYRWGLFYCSTCARESQENYHECDTKNEDLFRDECPPMCFSYIYFI